MINLACQSEKQAGLFHQFAMALPILGRELAQSVGNQVFPRRQRKFAIRLQFDGNPPRFVGSSVEERASDQLPAKIGMIWVHPTDMQDRTRPSLPFFILKPCLSRISLKTASFDATRSKSPE